MFQLKGAVKIVKLQRHSEISKIVQNVLKTHNCYLKFISVVNHLLSLSTEYSLNTVCLLSFRIPGKGQTFIGKIICFVFHDKYRG